MAAKRIRALCKRNVIYIQIRVKHLESTLGYMGNFFNNGSMTMKFHILNMLYDLESHAKDGRCGLSRKEDIRQCVGKLVEKQTLIYLFSNNYDGSTGIGPRQLAAVINSNSCFLSASNDLLL